MTRPTNPARSPHRPTHHPSRRRKCLFESLEDRRLLAVYSSGDVPQSIPDRSTIESSLFVPDSLTIGDIDVELDISHTRDQDLDVYLIAPDLTRIQLFTDVGGGGDNFSGTTLDDEAPNSITAGTAPFTGSYRPEGDLAAFDGKDAQGEWKLEISDDKRRQTGTLNSWSIGVTAAGPALPILSIDDVQLREGDSGTTSFVFTVTRSGELSAVSSVDFATADGTATSANSDYVAESGTLNFGINDGTKTVIVVVQGDTNVEADEAFSVNLSNAVGATVADPFGVGTITTDDGIPAPEGLVSWWTADATTADLMGRNDAVLIDGAGYAAGQVGQAFDFDGVNDRVQLPDSESLKLTESLSIEGWINVRSYPNSGHGLILFRGDDRGGLDPYFMTIRPDGALQFSITALGGGATLTAPISLNQFLHVAGTLDDATGTMRLYVDGFMAAETTTNVRPFGDLDASQNPGIGIGNHGGASATPHNFPFDGLIDELSVYNRALTDLEVQGIYDAGAAGKVRMTVAQTAPDLGGVVTTAPTEVQVNFTFAVDPTSVHPADLRVNGLAADGVVLDDPDTATFSFLTSPVTSEGLQSIQIAEGSILRESDGLGIGQFDSSFRHDSLPMQVVSTDPAPGADLLVQEFDTAATAVVSMAGMDGGNGGWPLLYGSDAVSSTGLKLAVDEDQLGDSERSHTQEQLGYIAFDNAPAGNVAPYLQTGIVSGVTNSVWTTATLNRNYTSMVVVATPNYTDSSPPLITRVQNANGNSFQIMVQRADGQATNVSGIDVQFAVVEAGVYTTATHGVAMEAVRFTSTVTDGSSSWLGESRSYLQPSGYLRPVVVGQVMSANEAKYSAFWTRGAERGDAPTGSHLYVGKHVGEDPNTARANEEIGYIVLEAGQGSIGATEYLAGLTSDTISGIDNGAPFDFALNTTTLQVDFNEVYDASTLGVDDLTVSAGVVSEVVAIDADSVQYTLNGVTAELTVDIMPGALTDLNGNPTVPFSATYSPEDVVFSDSFEIGAWNDLWVEDNQDDWFQSTQRAVDGSYSAEVDGRATDATLTMANPVDLSGYGNATLSFSWGIESGFDSGEYLALDVFDGSWQEIRRLRGNVDQENTWHSESVDLAAYLVPDFRIRFRALANRSNEDGNVDNVQIVARGTSSAFASESVVLPGLLVNEWFGSDGLSTDDQTDGGGHAPLGSKMEEHTIQTTDTWVISDTRAIDLALTDPGTQRSHLEPLSDVLENEDLLQSLAETWTE